MSLLAPTIGAGTPAAAQLLQDAPTVVVPPEPPIATGQSVFARQQPVGVADRVLPAFSAHGTTIGAFDLFPAVSIGGLYASNVLANNEDRRSDIAIVVRPEITVRTSTGPYRIAAYGRGDIRRYAHQTSEDTEEVLGGVEGSVALGSLSSITAGASYGSLIEPRYASDSPVNAAKPLEYDAFSAFGSATIEGASTRVILRGGVVSLRFGETPGTDGGLLYTRDRDRTRYQGLVRLERALSPAVSVYGAATGNRITYAVDAVGDGDGSGAGTRDSTGFGVYAGSSFEVTSLMRGDVRVGYIRQDFDRRGIRPLSGIGALGTLVYSPSGLRTITGKVESSIEDSGVPGSGGFLHRGGSLRVDNELRRYIVLSLEGGYFRDTYRGLNRQDRLPYADAGVTYLSRGHWNARLGYRYLARSSGQASGVASFDDHRVSVTLTLQD